MRLVFRVYTMAMILLQGLSVTSIAQAQNELEWQEIDGVSIPIPPTEHPRLYLREWDIPDLERRMSDPVLYPVWKELERMAAENLPDVEDSEKSWRYYVQQRGAKVRAELYALRYLVSRDKTLGRKAIKTALDTMKQSVWPPGVQDIARSVGRMMVTGAIVYDWCYDLLTPIEKEEFVAEFLRMARMLECGYPPVTQGSVTGHSAEWMIMRDLISAGIAIYDEFPEMYELTAGRIFREHIPVRNWFYPSHAYHQGSSYNKVRYASDLYALWIFDRMGAGNVFHPSMQFIPYHWFYIRRPDGQFLPSGDVNYSRGKPVSLGLLAMLSGSYFQDEYINNEFLKSPSIDSRDKFFEFLWRDTDLGMKEPDDLPLTRYFGYPHGWMVARTGWGKNSVIAEMKINEYNFINHQHHDAGAFQIYYRGPLAIDAGMYSGTSGGGKGYNSPHNKNYFKRTIAHNSLLIYDPDEVFKTIGYGGKFKTEFAENDGGQRLPGDGWFAPKTLDDLVSKDYKTGKVLAQGFGPDYMQPDYTYLKGDITEAYSSKVKEVKRSFVFLNFDNEYIPASLIVFDKVISSNPEFRKYWLLHSIEEPVVTESEIIITRTKNGDSGKLINTALLPGADNSVITAVGGPGKEFWVFGENYENEPIGGRDPAGERGKWRIEISPSASVEEDYFLNVMQVMDKDYENRYEVELIEGDKVVGAQIGDRVVIFSKDSEDMSMTFSFNIEGEHTFGILITDMVKGTWQVLKGGKVMIPAIQVRNQEGTIYFRGSGGEYKILR
jgi:heparin/heparan-sulfate lyase